MFPRASAKGDLDRAECEELVRVNRGPTPLDDRADLTIDAAAGETLSAAREQLEQMANLGQS